MLLLSFLDFDLGAILGDVAGYLVHGVAIRLCSKEWPIGCYNEENM